MYCSNPKTGKGARTGSHLLKYWLGKRASRHEHIARTSRNTGKSAPGPGVSGMVAHILVRELVGCLVCGCTRAAGQTVDDGCRPEPRRFRAASCGIYRVAAASRAPRGETRPQSFRPV